MRVVTREQMEKLVNEFGPRDEPGTVSAPGAGDNRSLNNEVRERINRYGLEIRSEGPCKGGYKFVPKICPFDSSHKRSAVVIHYYDTGVIYFKCHHQSCTGKSWDDVCRLDEPDGTEGPVVTPDSKRHDDEASPAEEGSHYNWPDPLEPEAYYGLAGEVVSAIEPHSEADPAALLIQLLQGIGSIVGHGPYFVTDGAQQFSNFNCLIVGRTAKGRKGTSWAQVRRVLGFCDEEWRRNRIVSGLSSGEGVIWAVHDPVHEHSAIREKGRIAGYQEVESDPGISDKRLFIFEAEFSKVLRVCDREGSTLSPVIREAFDTGDLNTLTKNKSARATGAHISIDGHITKDELRRLLTDSAIAGGFANRFAMVCARRSKLLPEGGRLHEVDFTKLVERLAKAMKTAGTIREMHRDERARAIWRDVYGELSEGEPGLLGAVTSRADTLTVRFSNIYALLDSSRTIREEHLLAALAVWRYCYDSARFIFGDAVGDETADEILRRLRSQPDGMTRTEIRDYFQRHKGTAEISRALGVLQEYGLARMERGKEQEDHVRPTEHWYAL